jgi:O-antigen/teichoic acid export membrane protein
MSRPRSTLWREYGHSLFGHASVQLAARAYTSATQLVVFGMVGALGSDRLIATFALSMAAAGLLSTLVDFGAGLWVIRNIADGESLPRLLIPRATAVVLGGLGVVSAAALEIITWAAVPWVLLIGTAIGASSLWRGVLWGRLHHEKEALASVLQASILVVLIGVALALGADSPSAPLLAATVAYGTGYLARRFMARGMVRVARELVGLGTWVRQVYSYAGQAVVTSAQTQADLLLLAALWSGPAAGVAAYALAMRFYYAIGMPFEALGTAILPRVALRQRIRWERIVKVGVPGAALALLTMWALTSSGSLFGLSAAGAEYLETIGVILCFALPWRFASYVFGAVVTGSGRQTARFASAIAGLATMLTLDVLLIPWAGPSGAAAALACADAVLMIGYAWASRQTWRSVVL